MPGLSLTLDSPIDSDPLPSKLAFRRPPPPWRSNNVNVDSVKANGISNAENSGAECEQTGETHQTCCDNSPAASDSHSSTLPITPSQQAVFLHPPPVSPSHLTLLYSNHTPPASVLNSSFNFNLTNGGCLGNVSSSPPMPVTPSTARPTPTTSTPGSTSSDVKSERKELVISMILPNFLIHLRQYPTSSDAKNEREEFIISTILPNFLFLGPELISPSHVSELKSLGVKRIINIAAECTDDHEAALYNAPTYVHCKTGKSRSVTAVMVYLIHSHHWPLACAYQFVLERRKGISPNIGFVSKLIAFEEAELGRITKPKSSATVSESSVGDVGVGTGRRPAHVRESLPPMPSLDCEEEEAGDKIGQDMEIRDREGRYPHVRRAPVDENTLQPIRRVSKAGLKSARSINSANGDVT
ncbi:hypothetical protein DFJ58DRAFT_894407 [Suillus subalutaceus]|uniref:uncharacterized protein n=1 Tax=Suillus subalutaceus TaxID=48586 RepID=UPI001B866885|nr:uncharacterized protein DFJ58DRAFT_894407 [Suillus subalutaceus]KAG1844849.1 hypothetical protein DFJ58DRAFT_894407 [Suillus subalutaceus]